MTMYRRLLKRQQKGQIINVAVCGAGLIGRGTVRQINITPGMRTALIVNRNVERAVQAHLATGVHRGDIVVSDDLRTLQHALLACQPAVTTKVERLRDLQGLDVAVEVTGAVEYGAEMALHAIAGGKHVIMMNAETDATVGCALRQIADDAGVVYSNSDGDQPGVLMRLIEYVQCLGFEVIAAVNCKGFMDVNATPDTIRPWAQKQNTSLPMTTAFTDGTKMNIENCVVCNATGLVPDVRGMHGVKTDLPTALRDCMAVFSRAGVVDYTLGGTFGGGVFVIARCDEPMQVQPLMKYLKMGDGPEYLFYRPYHLCHFETPFSIAEAALDGEPTIAPLGQPVADVVAVAKRDLHAGERLDGIGGYMIRGEIDTADNAADFLPVGLAESVVMTRTVHAGEGIPMSAVSLNANSLLMRLRQFQQNIGTETDVDERFAAAINGHSQPLAVNGHNGDSPRRRERTGVVADDRFDRWGRLSIGDDDSDGIEAERPISIERSSLKPRR